MILKMNFKNQWIFTDNYSFAILIADEGEELFGRVFYNSSKGVSEEALLLALKSNAYLINKANKKNLSFRYYDFMAVSSQFLATI